LVANVECLVIERVLKLLKSFGQELGEIIGIQLCLTILIALLSESILTDDIMALAKELHEFDDYVAVCDRSMHSQRIRGVSCRVFTRVSIGCLDIFLNQFLLLFRFMEFDSDCLGRFGETFKLLDLGVQLDHFHFEFISRLLGFVD
jgi:hypothetical protein